MINSTKKKWEYAFYIANCKQQFGLWLAVWLCTGSLLVFVATVFSTDGSSSDIGDFRWWLGGTCVVLLGLGGMIWWYLQGAKNWL